MRTHVLPCLLGAALAAIVLTPIPAGAVGEQVGRIRGVVTSPENDQPIAGVTVEATSSALIGPPRATRIGVSSSGWCSTAAS